MSLNQNPQVQAYISSICSRINNRRVHEEIRIELLGHIEEAALEYISTGVTEDEAIGKAVIQMGDAELVGRQLNKIHKTQPEWSILIMTILMAGLGLFAMYFIESKGALLHNYHVFNRSVVSPW